jgi:TRAP-type mannitol/chloroaromatic compound transport system permease small subunit
VVNQAKQTGISWLRNGIAFCGKTGAWLMLVMVLLSFFIVVLRYGFNLGWIGLQESVTYLHVTVFMVVTALPYVASSSKLLESSREAGGLPLVFLLKSLILVMPVLLLGQGLLNSMDTLQTLRRNDT